jgi:hypothetical protein
MRILSYIIETLVLGFIVTAVIFMSKQSKVTDKDQELSADTAEIEGFDRLSDTAYFNHFGEDSTTLDSTAVDTTSR